MSRNVCRRQKKVLVLMSTFNGEKYIEKQIESIENQKTDCVIDVLIRDDGSSDNTVDIIKRINKKYNNIKLIVGCNVGFNNSFFELFRMAEGYDYYAISDQDDIWKDTKIQESVCVLKDKGEDIPIVFGSCSCIIDDDERILGVTRQANKDLSLKNTIIQNIVPGHSQMFNNKMLDFLKKENDVKQIYVYDYWITNVAMVFGKLYFSNEPLVKYRVHNSNTIGYGKNKLGWVKERLRRVQNGDGKKITKQIKHFYTEYGEYIDDDSKKEIKNYIESRVTLFRRLKFVFVTKLYRQRMMETIFFKIAYLMGRF